MCSRARTDSLTCVAYCVLVPSKAACRMSSMRVRRAVVSRSRGRYQAGHEPAEHVAPHEEAQPLTVLDVEDGRGRVVQLVGVDLEQLLARG